MLKDHVKQVSDHRCAVQTDVAAWISFMSVLLSFHRRSRGLSWHIWGRRIHAQCFSSGKHQVIHASILHRSFSDDMTAWLSRLSPLSPLSPRHVQKWWQSGQAQSNQCPWLLPRKWRLRSARRWWLRLPREVWTIRPWPTGNDRLGSTCHHLSLCELLTKTKPPFAWDVSLYSGLFFLSFQVSQCQNHLVDPCRSVRLSSTASPRRPGMAGAISNRNPKVVKGKKTKPADAKGTMVYRTGKANDPRAWIPWIPWIPIVKYWDPAVSKRS